MENYNDLRITKLREYLMDILTELNKNYTQLNINHLSQDIENYSLDKIPVKQEVENWIIGDILHRDIYSFRSRMNYSPEVISNLMNVGFFESFEKTIKDNNESSILPDIDGIESIKCLNCGTMNRAGTNTAEFDIQIEIVYRENPNNSINSI